MRRARRLARVALLAGVGFGVPIVGGAQLRQPSIIGRWDLTISATGASYPSWLEVQRSGDRTLVGRFVGRFGSARPISKIESTGNMFGFSIPPQWEPGDGDLRVEGTLSGDEIAGWLLDPAGNRQTWTGRHAPTLRRETLPEFGTPITLFDGSDMSRWRPSGDTQWRIINRILTNTRTGANLITRDTFTDFKLHVEFRYPKGSNSGVYLRGRYEVQIEDSTQPDEAVSERLGAIYGFLAPNANVAKRPGEWQAFDITLVGRLVTVVLNGKTIIGAQEIPGITGGALDSDEAKPGPLLLQGDHGSMEFRNIYLTPAK